MHWKTIWERMDTNALIATTNQQFSMRTDDELFKLIDNLTKDVSALNNCITDLENKLTEIEEK